MNKSEAAVDNAIEVVAASLEPTDARLWRRLLIYVPDWLGLERGKHIKNRVRTDEKDRRADPAA